MQGAKKEMAGNILHWNDRKVEMTYHTDAVHRKAPMMVKVPLTFEDPDIDLHDARRLLHGVLTKLSRNPGFDWLVNVAAGMGTLRPKEERDGFEKGNWVAIIYCHAKYRKAYQDYLKSVGMLHYEEDEA
jgi:hypothetical protein